MSRCERHADCGVGQQPHQGTWEPTSYDGEPTQSKFCICMGRGGKTHSPWVSSPVLGAMDLDMLILQSARQPRANPFERGEVRSRVAKAVAVLGELTCGGGPTPRMTERCGFRVKQNRPWHCNTMVGPKDASLMLMREFTKERGSTCNPQRRSHLQRHYLCTTVPLFVTVIRET